MSQVKTALLLIEADIAEARRIQQTLAQQDGSAKEPFCVEWVAGSAEAICRLEKKSYDIVLLGLGMPDEAEVEVLNQVLERASSALVLIVCSDREEEIARRMVERGAYDYLFKGHLDAHWLPRALRYVLERKAVQDALRDSEARFRAMSDASPLGIFVSDVAGGCVYTNAAYSAISGLSAEQMLGRDWSALIHPEDRLRVLAEYEVAEQGNLPFQTEMRVLRNDGSSVWASLNAAPMRAGETRLGQVQTIEDISQRKMSEHILQLAEDALFDEKERAQVTLNSIGDAVLTTDLTGRVSYLNLVAETMTGWTREAALGRPLNEVFRILDGATREIAANPAQEAIDLDKTVGLAAGCLLVRQDGSEFAIEDSAAPIHNRDGQVMGAVIVFHDVSESRSMALKMAHLAQHDFLTGLPNRLLLTERLSQAIGIAHRHQKQVALLFLDLDYFKHVNDSLGHSIGDQLLQSVGSRLTSCVRATDTVCRQGGDEFVILLAEIEQHKDAALVAETLITAFGVPHLIAGHELHVPLSIGISVYPDDGSDADTILQNADAAMYHAKASGRNNYQFFRTEFNTQAVQRLVLESSLRRAMKMGEFVLYYQPKIDLNSGLMTGAEALIRWLDPELGMVYPAQFVPVAEECGLIVPIGRWVLREACNQIQRWRNAGLQVVPVAVNISAVEFRHKDFLPGVAQILEETGIDAYYLELELTESILMHEAESSATVLEALKAMGVRLAIDDFGTGYSSLSYLKRFPIDTLKIDQSFVQDIVNDADDAAIVSAVIGMARNLKQRVIAEGVETYAQLSFLRNQQCDEGQGFQFSHPLAARDFSAWLNRGSALH